MGANEPRLRCERYHADIPVATCLARRRNIRRAQGGGVGMWTSGGQRVLDANCLNCAQGERIERHYREEPHMETIASYGKKTCKACGQEKPLEEFYKTPNTTDKREGTCKQCKNRRKAAKPAEALPPRPPAVDPVAPPPLPAQAKVLVTVRIDCTQLVEALRGLVRERGQP
jgi:hypothetical protein